MLTRILLASYTWLPRICNSRNAYNYSAGMQYCCGLLSFWHMLLKADANHEYNQQKIFWIRKNCFLCPW